MQEEIMSTNTRTLPLPKLDQLNRYLQQVRAFPLLDAEEELALARRMRAQGDREAAHRLVTSHLRLVAKVAKRYRGYDLPVSDLIAEGNLGLIRAVMRFDPDRGFRLATYALWWIRAAIQEYVLHSWSLVRIGNSPVQKRLFFNLRRLKAKINAMEDGELSVKQADEIAESLKVKGENVLAMDRRLATRDMSLNAPLQLEGGDEWQDSLVDETPSPEARLAEDEELAKRRTLLKLALGKLGERERDILIERRLKEEGPTLHDLSLRYHISRERVRQIEVAAYEKLKRAIQRAAVPANSVERLRNSVKAHPSDNGTAVCSSNASEKPASAVSSRLSGMGDRVCEVTTGELSAGSKAHELRA
jgi:RNA polymerase sigma-32 factor